MTVSVYKDIVENVVYGGRDAGRTPEKLPSQRVILFVRDVPEGTPVDEVVRRLASNGNAIEEGALIAPDAEWPEEVRRVALKSADLDVPWSDLR